jgi:anti-sigma factor (TIGR02949 family)
MTMECIRVRDQLLAYQRGQLPQEVRDRITAHLEGCPGCRQTALLESELSTLLEQRLPRHPAPPELRRYLEEGVRKTPAARPRGGRGPLRIAVPISSAVAAAAMVLLAVRITQPTFLRSPSLDSAAMVDEGVNDHLRVVTSAHPLDIESGGIHQVKPWFTGRLDFAPRVSFAGDDEFQLAGGSTGYFRDRKAATFVFKRRLHTVSLFVFRAEGLPWPTRDVARLGALKATTHLSRGFSVLLWRQGELGYCLVSDIDLSELELLAQKIVAP